MPNYDFRTLSHQDFELLVRDVLQAKWDVVLQTFTAGRDQGIDLLLHQPPSRTIIQCKHYVESGFDKLLAHVRKVEVPKAAKLKPTRYLLATSVGLTPGNKQTLASVLAPYVLSTDDILGRDDINNLLAMHPDVERAQFKLWLTSTAVLEAVLHNAEHSDTDFEVRRVHSKLKSYVMNDCYPRALRLLEDGNIVVISGIPGIGKTTLAELLLFAHLEKGYSPVVIHGDVSSGKKLFKRGVRQIFYYDDFLGETFLGDGRAPLSHNRDAALLGFMEMIRQSESKLVMTTREHVLSSAIQTSERLRQSTLLDQRCILKLSDYSFRDKARILYNHIYFGDLPSEHRQQIVGDDFFLEILAHRNFSPRQVEWLTSFTRVKKVPGKGYRTFVTKLLDNPGEIWRHSFERQISPASQALLLTLLSLGGGAHFTMLEPAWQSLNSRRATRYGLSSAPDAFKSALKELEGSFITLKLQPNRAELLNPSVKDFLQSIVAESQDNAADLLASLVYFTQLGTLWTLSGTPMGSTLRSCLEAHIESVVERADELLSKSVAVVVLREPGGGKGYVWDVVAEARLGIAVEMVAGIDTLSLWHFCQHAYERLSEDWRNGDTADYDKALYVLDCLEDVVRAKRTSNHGRAIANRIIAGLREQLLWKLREGRCDDFYRIYDLPKANGYAEWSTIERRLLKDSFEDYLRHRFAEDRFDHERDDWADLASALEAVADAVGCDVSEQLEQLRDDEDEEERPRGRSTRKLQNVIAPSDLNDKQDVEAVKRMFRRLLD